MKMQIIFLTKKKKEKLDEFIQKRMETSLSTKYLKYGVWNEIEYIYHHIEKELKIKDSMIKKPIGYGFGRRK